MVHARRMKVGASKVRVTPDSGVFLSGFPRGRRSTGVHDDIWVRCLSIDDDKTLLSIATADVWGVLREDVDSITSELKLGSTEHLLLCSTHVHSAPDMLGIFGPDSRTSGTDEKYVQKFRSAVVQCVNDSRLSMREVSVRISSGKTRHQNREFEDSWPCRQGLSERLLSRGGWKGGAHYCEFDMSTIAIIRGEHQGLERLA